MVPPTGWRAFLDDELERIVADDLQDWLDENICDPANEPKVHEPSPGQLALFAITEFEQALWNEGVHTALYNDDGIVLPAAKEGYRHFGIPQMERFVGKIIQFLEFTPYPYDRDERMRRLPDREEFAAEFDALYNEFENTVSVRAGTVANYIRAHPEEFFES